uniref:Gag-pol polyprotein n=1 Tax=Solanum tuberosum TaxID=4113 RepID=M1DIB8_SOLTU
MKEYSLKFTQLSKYAPTLVANSRARMNKFVMGVSGLVEEECRIAMLHHDMDISRLMVYAQQLEETKLSKMNRDMKRARMDEQNQSRSKKMFYNQDSSMVNNDRVSNPKPQRGNRGDSTFERPRCAT